MKKAQTLSSIHVEGINLWAHVGVLEEERLLGQPFVLDFIIWLDVEEAALKDDISKTADYRLAVTSIQKIAFEINCKTIEHFSEQLLDQLEFLYGSAPMQIILKKCSPPINGFSGHVSIKRKRNSFFT